MDAVSRTAEDEKWCGMIAIKGMKMPKICLGCSFCRVVDYGAMLFCNVLYTPCTAGNERRLDNCPLTELHDGLYQIQAEKIWKYHGKGER